MQQHELDDRIRVERLAKDSSVDERIRALASMLLAIAPNYGKSQISTGEPPDRSPPQR